MTASRREPFRDYAVEYARLGRIARTMSLFEAASAITPSLKALGVLVGDSLLGRALQAAHPVTEVSASGFWFSQKLIGSKPLASPLLHALWCVADPGPALCWGMSDFQWRLVAGVPCAAELHNIARFELWSPETVDQLMERLRAQGASWVIQDGKLEPWDPGPALHVPARVQAMIERTRKFRYCRSWLFWGPPGGGKTEAARQLVESLCGSVVWVQGHAATAAATWAAIRALRPEGIIIDDIDSLGDSVDMLLAQVKNARSFARVIVTTANLPDKVRGALRRKGRLADEEAQHFAGLDDEVAKVIAPSVPASYRDRALLACALAELEERAVAGLLTPEDRDEMIRCQVEVGES